jgi:hypothetical protein
MILSLPCKLIILHNEFISVKFDVLFVETFEPNDHRTRVASSDCAFIGPTIIAVEHIHWFGFGLKGVFEVSQSKFVAAVVSPFRDTKQFIFWEDKQLVSLRNLIVEEAERKL